MPSAISKKSVAMFLILAIAIGAGTTYWFKAIHPFESTDNAYLKAHMSIISPKISGYVKEVAFADNQNVQPGDLLAVIDPSDFQAKVVWSEAQIAVENARIKTLETEKQAQQAIIQQEQANITAAAADLERTGKDLQRFKKLLAEGAISAQNRDAAEAAFKQAGAHVDKYRSARQQAASQLTALDAQIGESQARLKVAQAALDMARIDLANTRIVAPIAGHIGNRSVQVGQLVKPGSALAYLIPAAGLFVEANFKETQIAKMQPDQPVQIRADAYPDQHFTGTVESFAPASGSEFSLLPPENATGNFTKIVRRVPVKIRFDDGSDLSRLKPGLSVVVKVQVR